MALLVSVEAIFFIAMTCNIKQNCNLPGLFKNSNPNQRHYNIKSLEITLILHNILIENRIVN